MIVMDKVIILTFFHIPLIESFD